MINLPIYKRGGIQGRLLSFRKVFNIVEYAFKVLLSFDVVPDRCEKYFFLDPSTFEVLFLFFF